MKQAIEVEGLVKRYGEKTALNGISFAVPAGSVLGVLGPNGAGKTTAVRVLATLLAPDGGRAAVDGYDVVRQGHQVRGRIGLTGQFAAVDEALSGFDNLRLVGRLLDLGGAAGRRAEELIERFELTEAARRPASTYSGGMRRRLDLAVSLVAHPSVLFLDEPTTGLDPHSRNRLWELIRGLVADGTTVLLTTQYLEEADQLADSVVVIDDGTVVAEGTPDQLKAQVGGQILEVRTESGTDLEPAAATLGALAGRPADTDHDQRRLSVRLEGQLTAPEALRRLDTAGIRVTDLALRSSTLDEVFLALTGRPATTADTDSDTRPGEQARADHERALPA